MTTHERYDYHYHHTQTEHITCHHRAHQVIKIGLTSPTHYHMGDAFASSLLFPPRVRHFTTSLELCAK